jgi:hypothetical protein
MSAEESRKTVILVHLQSDLGKCAIYAGAGGEKQWFIKDEVSTSAGSYQGSSGDQVWD